MTTIRMRQQWLDGLAIGASSLCLIHCLFLPLALILLPALGALLALPETFHFWGLVVAVPTSALAIGMGYAHHRLLLPAVLAVSGILFLGAAELLFHGTRIETLLAVLGSVQLAVAHAVNLRAAQH